MQNYILKVDALGLKKGAVAEPTKGGKGYIIWLEQEKEYNKYLTMPAMFVENSEYFEKEEETEWGLIIKKYNKLSNNSFHYKDWEVGIEAYYFFKKEFESLLNK